MYINKIDENKKEIFVNIPLTWATWKTRVKNRSTVFDYWVPYATRSKPFLQSNYIERQIWYDAEVKDKEKMKLTTLQNINFTAYNTKEKALYELSEYLYYFYKWNMVKNNDLEDIINYLNNLSEDDLIDSHKDCRIQKTHPITKTINNIEFYELKVSYPLLIHKFWDYEIITEIIIKEKQRAIWVQSMLYFCFPITELQTQNQLVWRIAEKNEFAHFVFDKTNYSIILEMIKIFGILSKAHKTDILRIIETIRKNVK